MERFSYHYYSSNNPQNVLFVFQDLCTVVPHWIRYKELIAILEASLQDIVDRWADGKVASFCCYLDIGVCYFFFYKSIPYEADKS